MRQVLSLPPYILYSNGSSDKNLISRQIKSYVMINAMKGGRDKMVREDPS